MVDLEANIWNWLQAYGFEFGCGRIWPSFCCKLVGRKHNGMIPRACGRVLPWPDRACQEKTRPVLL